MEEVEILVDAIGNHNYHRRVVMNGKCPFCGNRVTFRQLEHRLQLSKITGKTIPLQCEGCHSFVSYSIEKEKFYPAPMLDGLKGLPEEIDKYYQEGLRCISADSPDGAVTLFRKVIHALGIHYGIAKKNNDKNLYDIVKELHNKEHIVKKLKDALLGVKDIGNDGAHVNENEPDIEQALKLKHLIDTVLNSTVLCDSHLSFVKEKHSKKDEIAYD